MIPLLVLAPLCTLCAGRGPDVEGSVASCPRSPQVSDCGALALYNEAVDGADDLLGSVGATEYNADLAMRFMGRPLSPQEE